LEKNSETAFSPKKWLIQRTPQELSNEWSCQYVTTIFVHLRVKEAFFEKNGNASSSTSRITQ
jgi:hypothetical protein